MADRGTMKQVKKMVAEQVVVEKKVMVEQKVMVEMVNQLVVNQLVVEQAVKMGLEKIEVQ